MKNRSMRSVLVSCPATLLPTLRSWAMKGTLLLPALLGVGCASNADPEKYSATSPASEQLLAAIKTDREEQALEAAALRATVERANAEIKSLRAEIEKSRTGLAGFHQEMQTADENERRLRNFRAHVALQQQQFPAATQPSNE